jgi:hypothetical protein
MTSVDDRIRAGLNAELPAQTGVHAVCDRVVDQAYRRKARRRLAAVAASAVVVAAAAGVAFDRGLGDQRNTDPARPDVDRNQIVIPSPQSTTQRLEGTWVSTGWVRWSEMAATVESAGLGQWLDELHTAIPAQRIRLELRFDKGYFISSVSDPTGSARLGDRQLARVGNSRIVMHFDEGTPGRTTYRWTRSGDTLHLDLVGTTQGFRDHMPAQVYQRALYTTVAFHHLR